MRAWCLGVVCALQMGLALAAPAVTSDVAMGAAEARHLLQRTGFGARADEIRQFAGLSRASGVDALLKGVTVRAVTPYGESLQGDAGRPSRRLGELERRELVADQRFRNIELRAWWLTEMLHTPSPLAERMTLFWHNHFVSSERKVRLASLMRDQNQLFRTHALGNFGTLLHAVGRDPAMQIYLDAPSNRAGVPNENFAREVMELFTLGEGHYSEADVKEAARAFTGWTVDRQRAQMVFSPGRHDAGEKRIFGYTGRFGSDEVFDLLLARPETARFIVGKLWREFVSPTPEAAELERIAGVLRTERYALAPTLRALLLSDAFWAEGNRAALIKSPVELVVGSLRSLQIEVPDAMPFVRTLRTQGQDLFAPPNVRGWPGHAVWINTATLLERKQFLDRLARAEELGAVRVPGAMMRQPEAAPAQPAANEAAAQRRAERVAQLQQRVASATEAIRIAPGQWQASLSASELTAEDVLWASPAGHAASGMNNMAAPRDLRSLLLDPLYQIK